MKCLILGIDNTLATVVVVDLIGVNNLSRGLGLYYLLLAFTLLISTPLTGEFNIFMIIVASYIVQIMSNVPMRLFVY